MKHPSRRDFLKEVGAGAAALSLGSGRGVRGAQESAGGTKPLGYAVVGIGNLAKGEILPAFARTKSSRLTALVSGHPAKARHYARLYNVPERNIYNYQNYEQMGSNPEIDVVYVVLPNSMHAEYTIRAARVGKHVLSEKPMATSVKDAEEMVAACRQQQRRLMVAYRLHYERYNLAAMRACREKQLGQLKMIDAEFSFVIGDPTQWRLKHAMAGGGALMDIGIYCLQAARYLTGEEPVSVVAQTWSSDPVKFKEVEENISFVLKFPSGVIANCYSSYGIDGVDRYRAGGTEGWLEMEPAYVYSDLVQRTYRGGQFTVTPPSTWDQFAAEMDAFSEAIEQNRDVATPGEEGVRDMKIMMACYESAREGKAVSPRL
jgi:predicted dehydrogenase